MEDFSYSKHLPEVHRAMRQGGVFLTVPGKPDNTMTIGWGGVEVMWNRPVFMAPVRPSRHTYQLLKEAKVFTVSVPLSGQLRKELAFCGSRSGAEVDKFASLNLDVRRGRSVEAPILAQCELHYECRLLFRQFMDPDSLDPAVKHQAYPEGNYHTLFYGEIVDSYIL